VFGTDGLERTSRLFVRCNDTGPVVMPKSPPYPRPAGPVHPKARLSNLPDQFSALGACFDFESSIFCRFDRGLSELEPL